MAQHDKNAVVGEASMSQNAMKRLYLMQVGSMPDYQIPIVCYLVQTGDGKNILIDTGLPEVIPEGESEFENGQDVVEQLAHIGLKPGDIRPYRDLWYSQMLSLVKGSSCFGIRILHKRHYQGWCTLQMLRFMMENIDAPLPRYC